MAERMDAKADHGTASAARTAQCGFMPADMLGVAGGKRVFMPEYSQGDCDGASVR